MIHTVGDSHCQWGWKEIENVSINYQGPQLCYSFAERGANMEFVKNINKNDYLVFSFGEIDCRCHVNKHVNDNTTYKDIIDYLIYNYFKKINFYENENKNLKKISIFNIVPTNYKKYILKRGWCAEGDDNTRKLYVLYFNKKLKEYSDMFGYLFIDIYNEYTNDDGFLNLELSDGITHIKDPIYLKKFINKYMNN